MANELTLNATAQYSDAEDSDADLQVLDLAVSVATKRITRLKQAVGFAAEEALILGDVSSLGWVMLVNRDATNFVNVKTGTGGTVFAKLKAGEFMLLRFGSGVTAPFVQADTAACQLDVLIMST